MVLANEAEPRIPFDSLGWFVAITVDVVFPIVFMGVTGMMGEAQTFRVLPATVQSMSRGPAKAGVDLREFFGRGGGDCGRGLAGVSIRGIPTSRSVLDLQISLEVRHIANQLAQAHITGQALTPHLWAGGSQHQVVRRGGRSFPRWALYRRLDFRLMGDHRFAIEAETAGLAQNQKPQSFHVND